MPVVQVLVGVSCLLRPAVAMLCSLACFCMFLLACFGYSGFVGCCWDTCRCSWIKLEPGFTNPGWAIDDPVLLRAFELAMASHGSCTGCLTIVFPKVDLERLFAARCGKDFLMHPCHESLWMRTMYPWLITIQMLASAEHTCRCYQ